MFCKKIFLSVCLTFFVPMFGGFQSQEEVQKAVNFLTSTSDASGCGYVGTAGELKGKLLPCSYYSTPAFWGKYVCGENECQVTDVFNPDDYTLSPSPSSPGLELQYERVNVWNGTDIYDASTWQMALALAAKDDLVSAHEGESLLDLVENQNRLLFCGHDGKHAEDPPPVGANRATTQEEGTFTYRGIEITQPENAYYFRMVSQKWLADDPLMGTEYEPYLEVEDLPEDNPDYQKGKVSWADWKPITGENAWAFLIGPLQSDYLKYVEIEGGTYVPFASTSMQNALNVLYAFRCMQSPLGGIYYATSGSLGNVGSDEVNPDEISVENNASALAGLWIFQDLLKLSLDHEEGLTSLQREAVQKGIHEIDAMVYGGPTPHEYETLGLLSFFQCEAWNAEEGIFLQGGCAQDFDWIPTYAPKAVDVQTWTLTVLGQPLVDAWHGFGTAFRVWENTKEWGGFFGPQRELWGVGYSDEDDHKIFSAEWTIGAINMVRTLITQYEDTPYVELLRADEESMLAHLRALRTDHYPQTALFEDSRPQNYDELMALPDDKLAFLYANKRYFIPFGWYANPLPSTCSTSWAMMLHYRFNPFVLGGAYDSKNESLDVAS